jgi:hypothetical protein
VCHQAGSILQDSELLTGSQVLQKAWRALAYQSKMLQQLWVLRTIKVVMALTEVSRSMGLKGLTGSCGGGIDRD